MEDRSAPTARAPTARAAHPCRHRAPADLISLHSPCVVFNNAGPTSRRERLSPKNNLKSRQREADKHAESFIYSAEHTAVSEATGRRQPQYPGGAGRGLSRRTEPAQEGAAEPALTAVCGGWEARARRRVGKAEKEQTPGPPRRGLD